MKRRRNIIQRIIGVLVLLIAGSAVTLMSCASFGAKVSGQRLERVKASRHSQDGKFLNALPLSSVGCTSSHEAEVGISAEFHTAERARFRDHFTKN